MSGFWFFGCWTRLSDSWIVWFLLRKIGFGLVLGIGGFSFGNWICLVLGIGGFSLDIGFGLVFLDMLLFRSTIQRYLASCPYTRAKQPFYWSSVITPNPVNLRE
jgi:hypothetical protein